MNSAPFRPGLYFDNDAARYSASLVRLSLSAVVASDTPGVREGIEIETHTVYSARANDRTENG